jgi:hypothetical protein
MVTAEDERHKPVGPGALDLASDATAGLEDLRQEAGPLRSPCASFRERSLDVAAILDLHAGADEPIPQARVADRRRAHVHTAATGPEVERGSDDCHVSRGHGET